MSNRWDNKGTEDPLFPRFTWVAEHVICSRCGAEFHDVEVFGAIKPKGPVIVNICTECYRKRIERGENYMKQPNLMARISEDNTVELGAGECVVIEKLYGPHVYPDLRVYVDPYVPGWRIEIQLEDGTWDPIHVEMIE